jgi:outer membrane protein assembly factor BamA
LRRRTLFPTLAALLLTASHAGAASIRFVGDRPDGAEDLHVQELESVSQAALRISQELALQGYFWSHSRAAGDTLLVSAGPRAELGSVHAEPDSAVTRDCLPAFTEALGRQVNAVVLQEAMRALVSELVNRGRPYAQVRLLALDISNPPAVNVELAVYSGPEVYAGALVTGATRTGPLVFEREAGWQHGALLESELISESEDRLSTLPYVAALDTALLLAVTGDTADLYLGVREAAGVHAGGVLGYVPSRAGSEGYWAGELDLELASAFGDGRTIALNVARPDPASQRTRVNYWEPWPWGIPVWLGLDLGQEDFASDFIETKASFRTRLATHQPRWQFSATWGRVTLEEDPSPDTYPAEYLQAGIAAFDSSYSSAYRFEFDWSTQDLRARDSTPPPQDRIMYTQGRFFAHRWLPLSHSLQVRAILAGAGTLQGSGTIPQHVLYRVGGLYTLRGYREQQFVVRDYLRMAWEFHLGSRQQSLFVFADGAWLNFQGAPSQVLGSAGLGMRIAGRVLLMGAVPSQGGLSETKIHIGVTTGR